MLSGIATGRGRNLALRQAAWRLMALRTNRGLSQRGLAEIARVASGTVSRAENAKEVNEASQCAIAAVFGLKPTDIWAIEVMGVNATTEGLIECMS